MPIDNKELYDAMGASPNAKEDAAAFENRNEIRHLREEIEALQHVIAGATVAIVAGVIYAVNVKYDNSGKQYENAVRHARSIMEEVGDDQ